MSLQNKTLVIIGGAGLLGKQFSKTLARSGANIVVSDFDIDAALSVCSQLVESGISEKCVIGLPVDITDSDSISLLIKSSIKHFGQIDGVVNTAYPRNVNYGRKFEDVEFSDFCENINLNLGGYFLVSQLFAKYFANGDGGDIVNISSIYGVVAPKFEVYDDTSMTMPVEYAVIKSGLIHLTKYISKYYRRKNVRINAISPGGIFNGQDEKFVEQYNRHCNNIGMLSPVEIANVLMFLFSDKSLGISGQNIVVDDGFIL